MRRAGGLGRVAAAGAAAIIAYAVVASLSYRAGLAPVRPLYDGTAPPQPYRWVNPPPDLAEKNEPPGGGKERVSLRATGSEIASIATSDNQASMIATAGMFPPRAGETALELAIEPLDPETLAAPPSGLVFDGNAYRFTARYATSKTPAVPKPGACTGSGTQRHCTTIVLRYAFGAATLLRAEGSDWKEVSGVRVLSNSLQVFAETPQLGVFVAASPPRHTGGMDSGGGKTILIAVAVAAAAAIAGAFAMRMRSPSHAPARRGTRGGRARGGSPRGRGAARTRPGGKAPGGKAPGGKRRK